MIAIDLSDLKDFAWYVYMAVGFVGGVYIHSNHARHWLHWLIIKVFQGVIWMLHKTDSHYKEPRQTITKPQVVKKTEKELADFLSNPEVTIAKINTKTT